MLIVQNYIQSAKVLKKNEKKEGKSKIIRYFCIVKRFNVFFRAFLVVLLINLTTNLFAQDFQGDNSSESSAEALNASPYEPAWLDSVEISLLTCGPGQEVWSYYGHTAIRIEDKSHGTDLAVNWGMFSFRQDYFILRFVFGLTDYQIGIFPMSQFIAEYQNEGRWVKQQRLALTRSEKFQILLAIEKNNMDEYRTYRYNFFYDNCTTRARNMIVSHLGEHDTDFKNVDAQSTYRQEIHRRNENHRWARFGNDLLLGFMADQPICKEEWEFLPENLMKDFDTEARKDTAIQKHSAIEIYPQKTRYIKLIDSTFYVIQPQAEVSKDEVITPRMVFIALGIVIIFLCGIEWSKKKNFWWLDTSLLILTGLPGLILLAMIFSQHPTVQVNFQILLLNPLNLIFVWKLTKKARKGKCYWYYHVWASLIILALLLQIWQDYAEGMVILALSLLIRYAMRLTIYNLKLLEKKQK